MRNSRFYGNCTARHALQSQCVFLGLTVKGYNKIPDLSLTSMTPSITERNAQTQRRGFIQTHASSLLLLLLSDHERADGKVFHHKVDQCWK